MQILEDTAADARALDRRPSATAFMASAAGAPSRELSADLIKAITCTKCRDLGVAIFL